MATIDTTRDIHEILSGHRASIADIARKAVRAVMATTLILTLGMAAASCDRDGGASATGRVTEIIIPAGTQDKLDRGEPVNVMPAELYFKIGDVLRIRNDDSVDQVAGPFRVEAGKRFELTFGATGEYGGYCSLSGGGGYKIVITE